MKRSCRIILLGLVASLSLTTLAFAAGLTLSPETGALQTATLDGRLLTLPAAACGFRIYDATAKQPVKLGPGRVQQADGKATFDAQGDDLRLHAEFQPQAKYLEVSGYVENLRGTDRGLLFDYRLASLSADCVFSSSLEQHFAMDAGRDFESNAFPLAAVCGPDWGLAMAIPPQHPPVFGLIAEHTGMAIRFYLGLTPQTRQFPNRASFTFLVYRVEPAWGFRSALAKYYGFFPDYYTPRLKRDGLFMFQMGDRVPTNLDQYGFDLVETQWDPKVLAAAIARDKKEGIATFPYNIVGQREIKFLPSLPKDYDDAMAVFERWKLADQAGHAMTKENAASQGDIHLRQEVESSACKDADGRYCLVIRSTPWGQNSVSFKINPNPDLFLDQNRPTVASYAFELMGRWQREHPEYDGMFVDSLGANWPAVLNYRKDHFTYARMPLTVDHLGRIAIQNDLSHYEYLDKLRSWLRKSDKLLLANGVYAYKSKAVPKAKARAKGGERQTVDTQLQEFTQTGAPPEHYRPGTKLGRFFCAALLDVASSEAGVAANLERCQDVRTLMGKKHYAFLNYTWNDAAKVQEFVNKSLCYGIFASTTTVFTTGVHYEDHRDGYLRDKKLLDWYVPLVRKLSRAGWEPVRYATVEGSDVCSERFGAGDTVYFTLYNDGNAKTAGTLRIDLPALGFSASSPIREIGRNTPLASPEPGVVRLELEPKRAYVVEVKR